MSKRTPFIVRTIRNHTPQEINYASQKTISYSQFSIYNECPHKWELLYKEGLNEYFKIINPKEVASCGCGISIQFEEN